MVNMVKREVWQYDGGESYYYRITGCNDPEYGDSDSYPLEVSMNLPDYEAWREYAASSDFYILDGECVDADVINELSYLTLKGVNTGYRIAHIDVSYGSVCMLFENESLDNIEDCKRCRDVYFGGDYTPKFKQSLPIAYILWLFANNDAKTVLEFNVKAPRHRKNRRGKMKHQKFRITIGRYTCVREYHKKYHREIIFLRSTKEQSERNEQPVEIRESRM